MSLMKTLARMAVTVAVAKGASEVMKNRQKGGGAQGAGLSGLLGNLGGGGSTGGGLGALLGGLGAGTGVAPSTPARDGAMAPRAAQGGLGGLLESLGSGRGTSQGGLGGLLGGLAAGAGAGGLLGSLSGALQKAPEQNNDSFGTVLNSQFDETPEPPIQPSRDQEAAAGLMIAAMIQAAKSDGVFDDAEREKLLSHMGELDAEDTAFVEARLQAPVDIDALVADTPPGMGAQVYTMSVMAIDLDTSAEAKYLDKLAKAYGIAPEEVNDIHDQLGVPPLYT